MHKAPIHPQKAHKARAKYIPQAHDESTKVMKGEPGGVVKGGLSSPNFAPLLFVKENLTRNPFPQPKKGESSLLVFF